MERFIVASLLLLASAAAVEGRMLPDAVFDLAPRNRSGGIHAQDACQKTCNKVRFKAICRGLCLPKVPRGVPTPQQLLMASIRSASEKATEAKAKVDAYAARTHPTGPMVSILNDCSKGYDDAVQTLEEARQVAEAQGVKDQSLNTKASAATTSTGDCDNGFQDFDIPSPFAEMQKSVFRHVDTVLGITVAIQQAQAAHPAAAAGVRAPHPH